MRYLTQNCQEHFLFLLFTILGFFFTSFCYAVRQKMRAQLQMSAHQTNGFRFHSIIGWFVSSNVYNFYCGNSASASQYFVQKFVITNKKGHLLIAVFGFQFQAFVCEAITCNFTNCADGVSYQRLLVFKRLFETKYNLNAENCFISCPILNLSYQLALNRSGT